MTDSTPKTKRRRRKGVDDEAKLARGLVLALECLHSLYVEREMQAETDHQSVVAEERIHAIEMAMASVRSVNAGHALPEGDKP